MVYLCFFTYVWLTRVARTLAAGDNLAGVNDQGSDSDIDL